MAKTKPQVDPLKTYRVSYKSNFRIDEAPHAPPEGAPQGKAGKRDNRKQLAKHIEAIRELQSKLYADDRYSVLLVFQAMDAAGKDGTIRAVMSGINPAGCQVVSFKRPSSKDLDHDYLWRIHKEAPQRGRIGIFNRSHYEEVLVVKVNPSILDSQQLPQKPKTLFEDRYESIVDFEKHLARNGTVIIKFFLNVSKDEQRDRLVARIDDPAKNWKFEAGDLKVRAQWDKYMEAYEQALNATSRPWAPWYAIPADDKPFMRKTVAEIVRRTLEELDLEYPKLSDDETAALLGHRKTLMETK